MRPSRPSHRATHAHRSAPPHVNHNIDVCDSRALLSPRPRLTLAAQTPSAVPSRPHRYSGGMPAPPCQQQAPRSPYAAACRSEALSLRRRARVTSRPTRRPPLTSPRTGPHTGPASAGEKGRRCRLTRRTSSASMTSEASSARAGASGSSKPGPSNSNCALCQVPEAPSFHDSISMQVT